MTFKTSFLPICLVAGLSSLLVACDGYRLSINEQAIGPAPEVFNAYDIPDKNLRNCVSQKISDENIQHAGQLDYLNCSHENIRDLTGLAIFVSLARIDLSSNNIRDISELKQMGQLKLVTIVNNPNLDCPQVKALGAKKELNVKTNQCP